MLAILALCFLAAVEARPRTEFYASFSFPRIVGGSPASKGDFPHQLSLQHNSGGWYHTCGASLLSSRKALTAAHCTQGRSGFRVRAGATVLSPSDHEGEAGVAGIIEHPDYDSGAPGIPNDIATLHLSSSISSGGAVGYASLPSSGAGSYAGNSVFISGWGKTDGAADGGSNVLRQVRTTVISETDCRNGMPGTLGSGISAMHICIFSGNSGSCQGDSGGPMTHASNGLMIGVTSWGVGNVFDSCLTMYPSVYARVSYFRSWIDSN